MGVGALLRRRAAERWPLPSRWHCEGPRWWRAALFGTASAIGFAFTAALIKAVGDYFAQDWVSIFKHPQTYGLVLFGLASVYLAQNAYHAGPIVASQSTIVLVDPLVSILIGVSSVRRQSADQRSLGTARSHLPPGPVRRRLLARPIAPGQRDQGR